MKSIGLFLRYKVGCLDFIYLFIPNEARGEALRKESLKSGCARSTVQYSIFIKTPLRSSSDLIYKMEQRKKKEKKTNLQI